MCTEDFQLRMKTVEEGGEGNDEADYYRKGVNKILGTNVSKGNGLSRSKISKKKNL